MAIEAKTDDKRTNVLLKKETLIDELFKFKNQGIILGRSKIGDGWRPFLGLCRLKYH